MTKHITNNSLNTKQEVFKTNPESVNNNAEIRHALGYVCLNALEFSGPEVELPYGELESRNVKLIKALGAAYIELAQANKKIEEANKLIFVDKLTGCYNRAFYENFTKEFNPNGRHSEVGIVYADLNGLKETNDTLGHTKGDELIVSMADFLKSNFRNDDTVVRMGGDEFMVICHNYDNNPNFSGDLKTRVNEIKSFDSAPESAWGVAIYNEAEDADIQSTVARADGLMFEDKRATKGKVQIGESSYKVTNLNQWKKDRESRKTLRV